MITVAIANQQTYGVDLFESKFEEILGAIVRLYISLANI